MPLYHIKGIQMQDQIEQCSTCGTEFSLDGEGGISGYFGVVAVNFCPFCLSSMIDMVEQLQTFDEEVC
jgi:hypothetical protein